MIARARAEAAKRVRDNVDFDDLARLASLATLFSAPVAAYDQPHTRRHEGGQSLIPLAFTPLTDEQSRFAAMSPSEFVEVFISEHFGGLEHRTGNMRKKQIVGESTYRDMRWICLLLEKSLPPVRPFSLVTQDDFRTLDKWFERLPTTMGKSPKDKDPATTLEMIEEQALTRVGKSELDPEQIGLSENTSNKHWHNLSRIHEFLRTLVPNIEALSVSKYLVPEDGDAREAREKLTVDQGRAIFNLPPWTGCAGVSRSPDSRRTNLP